MRRALIIICLLLSVLTLQSQPLDGKCKLTSREGPYLLYKSSGRVRLLSADSLGEVKDTVISLVSPSYMLKIGTSDSKYTFDVPLHKIIAHPCRQIAPEKSFVISDLHGNIEAFICALISNSIINTKLQWCFGKNQLIVIGDIFDRGRDDVALCWLIYKLEQEAANDGGSVDYLLGNHDDMLLKGDLRYTHNDHKIFADALGMSYQRLWGSDSELGRWLRSRSSMIAVGENLFVHGGVTHGLIESEYSLEGINSVAKKALGLSKEEKKRVDHSAKYIFGDRGIFWYRGLVYEGENRAVISRQELDEVLKYYNVERVFVGHSEVDESGYVMSYYGGDTVKRYGGKVIAVNVCHDKNFPADRSCGILIDKGNLYSVTYSGKKTPL